MNIDLLYKVLGVDKTAFMDEIKAAYRRRAAETHPDHGGDAEEFKRVSLAGEVLTDPDRRAEYDRTGRAPGQSVPTMDERLETFVIQSLNELIDKAFTEDQLPEQPIKWMQEQTDRIRQACKHLIAMHEARIAQISSRLETFKQANYKSKNESTIELVCQRLEEAMRAPRRDLLQAKFNLKVTEAVMVALNDLSYPSNSSHSFNAYVGMPELFNTYRRRG